MRPAGLYGFGPFVFDARSRQLSHEGREITLTDRQAALLYHLVTQAGVLLSKDALVTAIWDDVAVTDNSLEQLVSSVRKRLRDGDGRLFIETVARRGYRFAAPVTRLARRETDDELEALLAPHRGWIEGRAALETFDREQIASARAVFEHVVLHAPDQAAAHVGLANACVMQFETTRTDLQPDQAALDTAAVHAREACRLDPALGESWATLGFVLARTGHRLDALAAGRRATALEPDNWRHQFRLASIGWGEERLRAARRALSLLPGFPLAHFLAATVHVARGALTEAARELEAGIGAERAASATEPRSTGVALHWLLGLVRLATGDEVAALDGFRRETALETSGHLYARECSANAWYSIGALRLRQKRADDARAAFVEALGRVPRHPLARVGLAVLDRRSLGDLVADAERAGHAGMPIPPTDRAIALAAYLSSGAAAGDSSRPLSLADAAAAVDAALAAAEPGPVGWTLPVEPLVDVQGAPERWAAALARLRSRAI